MFEPAQMTIQSKETAVKQKTGTFEVAWLMHQEDTTQKMAHFKDPVCLIDFNDIVSHRNDDQSCEETTRGTNSKPNLGLRKGNWKSIQQTQREPQASQRLCIPLIHKWKEMLWADADAAFSWQSNVYFDYKLTVLSSVFTCSTSFRFVFVSFCRLAYPIE